MRNPCFLILFLLAIAFFSMGAGETTTRHLGDPDQGPWPDDAKAYFGDPQTAIDSATAATDTIVVWHGTHTDSLGTNEQVMYFTTSHVLVIGAADDGLAAFNDSIYVSGESARRCMTVGPLVQTTYRQFGLKLGKETGSTVGIHRGGLLYCQSTSRGTYSNMEFDGGSVPRGAGGAIYMDHNAWAVFDSCEFKGNPTALVAPLIFADSPDSLIVTNSTFSGMGGGNGAQIVIRGGSGSDVKFENCTFQGSLGDLFEVTGAFNSFYIVNCEFQRLGGALITGHTSAKAVRVCSLRTKAAF